jgi:gas vesicle protein
MIMLVLLVVLGGCSQTPLTPSQTVQHFWAAMVSGDLENARHYVLDSSSLLENELQTQLENNVITFGVISIQSNEARIETTITNQKNESTTFNTVLEKQLQLWKVNYSATKKLYEKSREKKGLDKLVDDFHKFGQNFSGQLDDALKNWKEAKPALKKDLEELGSSVQKQLQDSIDKHGPELQKNLQEFTESLDKALEELEKGLPKEKEPEESKEPKARMI